MNVFEISKFKNKLVKFKNADTKKTVRRCLAEGPY